MLKKEIINQITDFVGQRPRTVQDIATVLGKNWRTADRYVDQIATETGMLSTHTFRAGTRGALKIVYATSSHRGSAYQDLLFQNILQGKAKEDFSPFDIYQFIHPDKREAFMGKGEYSTHPKLRYDQILKNAKHQILFFSGNMSWVEIGPKNLILKQLKELAEKKVSMKVLTKIDVTSKENVQKMLDINKQVGWDAIEVKHCEQPLRVTIIDGQFASMKEVLYTRRDKKDPSKKVYDRTLIFYRIQDQEWVPWLQKSFWHLFRRSVDAKTRLDALDSIRTILKK